MAAKQETLPRIPRASRSGSKDRRGKNLTPPSDPSLCQETGNTAQSAWDEEVERIMREFENSFFVTREEVGL